MHALTMSLSLIENYAWAGLDLQVLSVGCVSWGCQGYSRRFCPLEVIPVGFSLTCAEQRWDAEKMP